MTTPGKILLFGSGETSPRLQNSYAWLFQQLNPPVTVSILETPAGFEPNSDYVAGQVAQYLEKRLQNFRPQISVIPARKRGTAFSPDDPALLSPMLTADVLFVGPGSPTYAVRQLQESEAWNTLLACHRMGATLILASASVLAASAHTLPVYEIYKVGEELHWKQGLNLFQDFGLSLIFVPHWNNRDGGDTLDTSRCYMGEDRFDQLLQLLPADSQSASTASTIIASTIVGIDENTALIIDPQEACCRVMGQGTVTVIRQGEATSFSAGKTFPADVLGNFRLPTFMEGLPDAIVERVRQAKSVATQPEQSAHLISPQVSALLKERASARSAKNWVLSDQLRDALADLGWRVMDTGDGQQVEPI